MSTTNEQIEALINSITDTNEPAESQKLRMFAQGASFGFSDEIEARIAALVPGGPSYEEARNEVRAKLKAYEKQNPGKALTAEMAGAIIPSIVMGMTGVGAPGAGANIGRVIGLNAGQSALESVGKADADTLDGQKKQVAFGTGLGTVVGSTLEVLMGRMGSGGKKLYNALRKRYGSGYDTDIQQQLMGILESTDLNSIDDVITAVKNGQVIGDNPVLTNEIKTMVNAGGSAAETALRLSGRRAADTQETAVRGMNNALDPEGQNKDLYARVRDAEKQDLDDIGAAYGTTYGEFPAVPKSIADKMIGILQKNPEARSVLSKIYKNDPSTSRLFKVTRNQKTGNEVVELLRDPPNLQDAERLRRRIETMVKKEFETASGSPDLGEQLRKVEQSLRMDIDNFSPELAGIRADYAAVKANVGAFNSGSKSGLRGRPNENAYNTRDMTDDQVEAFRQGTLHSFNEQPRSTATNLVTAAREGENINLNLQNILPEDQVDRVMSDISAASNARKMNKNIQPDSGSQTQALQAAAQRRKDGRSLSGMDVLDASRGSVPATISLLSDVVKMFKKDKGYTDAQTRRVAEILFSQDPEFVTSALKDQTNWGMIADRADQIAPYVMRTLQTGVTQQAAASQPAGILESL